MGKESASKGAKGGAAPREGYFVRTRSLSLSFLYILPLLVIYEVGLLVLSPEMHNAAGVLVKYVMTLMGDGRTIFNLVVIGLLIVAWVRTNKAGGLEPGYLVVLCIESVMWGALMMVFAVVFTTVARQALPQAILGAAAYEDRLQDVALGIIHACGAGVYEELIFRLLLLGMLIWLFNKLMTSDTDEDRERVRPMAALIGVLVSAVLFALAHHIPGTGMEPITMDAFVFRTVCGFFLGVLYLTRGLAVAVYTHMLYDVYVFVIDPIVRANMG